MAAQQYRAAYVLDPDIFDRVSRIGVMAQSSSPEDRAAFSFMIARLYAQAGDVDRSLEYLRKAMEEGYKDIKKVYTDSEFATLANRQTLRRVDVAKTPTHTVRRFCICCLGWSTASFRGAVTIRDESPSQAAEKL